MADDFRQAVQRIRDTADIVEIIGRSVNLKKISGRFKGLCPFHQEKTPSFTVDPVKGFFKCFGCGVGGSVFDFVMQSERLSFMEAVEKLSKETNIELPALKPGDSVKRDEDRKKVDSILAANEEALRFFRKNLLDGRNEIASAYLPKRGLTDEICTKFEIGASVDSWDGLRKHLAAKGFTDQLMIEAGLCTQSESGRVYDAFRNRLMFPIFDQNGRAAGFGGRQLIEEPNSGKYINSKETALYKKSQILYALNVAQDSIRKSGYAILCEGYMDVIMLHTHGHNQAVASLGTALTAEHARLLKRYAPKVYFLYDADTAGRNNMLKGGIHLLASGFDVRVVELPNGDDPDTFLRREGSEALTPYLDKAEEFFDYAIRMHAITLNLSTLSGQAELVERITPMLAAIQNEVLREAAIARVLRRIPSIPRDAVDRIIKKSTGTKESGIDAPHPRKPLAPAAPTETPEEILLKRYERLDLGILKLLLEDNASLEFFRGQLREEWLVDRELIQWITFFLDHHEYAGTLLHEIEVTREFPGSYSVLTDVIAYDLPASARNIETAQQLLRRVHERHQQAITAELFSMIESSNLADEEKDRLLAAISMENRVRMKNSGRFLRAKDSSSRKSRTGTTPKLN